MGSPLTFNEFNYRDDKFDGMKVVRCAEWPRFGMHRRRGGEFKFYVDTRLVLPGSTAKRTQFIISPISVIHYSKALKIAKTLDSVAKQGINPKDHIEYIQALLGPLAKYLPLSHRIKEVENSRYGKLTVLGELDNSAGGDRVYMCMCDCGKKTKALYQNLKRGRTTTCGCGVGVGGRDWLGLRFGSLLVLNYCMDRNYRKVECLCDCGATIKIIPGALKQGRTKCRKKCTGKPKEEMISR